MKSFPMFIKTTGRRVVIAGGGEQAAQKTRLMLKTDAQITLLAPSLDDELAELVAEGRTEHRTGPITEHCFRGAAMAFVASGCPGTDAALHAIVQAADVPVNVVDQPALCEITTPSIVDRDPVVVAIGTEGTAPVLARGIKTEIEKMLAPCLGGFAALAGRLRSSVAQYVPREKRRAFWAWAFKQGPWQSHKRGAERDAAMALKTAIRSGGAPSDQSAGVISLVGAGPGARDLLTLRAVERLQEADIIFYDRLVDVEVLELARRDAERVFVGKTVGASQWPQDRICSVIIAAAKQGKRVVRLKSGDPMLFGRATEELAAAEAEGIEIDVVPGVTAASAGAAALKRSLTQRGETDTLVYCTGMTRVGDAPPDWAAHAKPGTTLAFYMSAGRAGDIASTLRRAGLSDCTEMSIATNVAKNGQKLVCSTLAHLEDDIAKASITSCCVLYCHISKKPIRVAADAAPSHSSHIAIR